MKHITIHLSTQLIDLNQWLTQNGNDRVIVQSHVSYKIIFNWYICVFNIYKEYIYIYEEEKKMEDIVRNFVKYK